MSHSWIIRFLEHRIADKRILRLIAKWLKVGIVEDGRRTRGVCGGPQGAVISPILANAYLHYVFDLWSIAGASPRRLVHDRRSLCGRHHRRLSARARGADV